VFYREQANGHFKRVRLAVGDPSRFFWKKNRAANNLILLMTEVADAAGFCGALHRERSWTATGILLKLVWAAWGIRWPERLWRPHFRTGPDARIAAATAVMALLAPILVPAPKSTVSMMDPKPSCSGRGLVFGVFDVVFFDGAVAFRRISSGGK